jgi:hypothetical protein
VEPLQVKVRWVEKVGGVRDSLAIYVMLYPDISVGYGRTEQRVDEKGRRRL